MKRNLLGILGLMLAFSLVAFAQEQSPTTTDDMHRGSKSERKERHRERMGHRGMGGHGMGRLINELNLSDSQREQIRAITQRRLDGTKSQREELSTLREKRAAGTFTEQDAARAQTLRQEIHNSMEGIQLEMEGILTAEQKTRLEQLKQENKARHEERKQRRELRNKERQEHQNENLQ